MFSYSAYVNHVTPGAGPFLAPEAHDVMLHTKYQDSKHCGFRHEEFFMFSLYKPL